MGEEQTRILQGDNCPDIVLNSGGPWFQQHLPETFSQNSWASLKSPKVSSVPKMEGFLNLIRLMRRFLGVGKLPHRSRIHTAYIGEDSSILGTWNVRWFNVSEIFLCPSLGEVLLHLPGEVSEPKIQELIQATHSIYFPDVCLKQPSFCWERTGSLHVPLIVWMCCKFSKTRAVSTFYVFPICRKKHEDYHYQ